MEELGLAIGFGLTGLLGMGSRIPSGSFSELTCFFWSMQAWGMAGGVGGGWGVDCAFP